MREADSTIVVTIQAGKGHLSGGPHDKDERPFTEEKSTLGCLTCPVLSYSAESQEWLATDAMQTLFGLCTPDGYLTQMHYGSTYCGPWGTFPQHARENGGYWYFDAGGNGRPIRIAADELERAMIELGLIKAQKET
jgi:hypothetical protein